MFFNCYCIKRKQTAIISFMECQMLTVDVFCFIWWKKATMICVVMLQNCTFPEVYIEFIFSDFEFPSLVT
jgi:hypothetical protein